MSPGNWIGRQPAYVRTFLLVVGSASLLLLIALMIVLQGQETWVPADTLSRDTLIPDETEGPHFTPATLTLRPITATIGVGAAAPQSLRWRTGVGIPDQDPLYFDWPAQRPGWYLNWSTNLGYTDGPLGLWRVPQMRRPDPQLGMEFVPMVRMRNGRVFPDEATLHELAHINPGLTWLIGNEPDVRWQDNTSPEIYAIAYQRAYTAIKSADPTAQVGIGGVSQVTPLRLAYLSRVWDFYAQLYGAPLPVDVWNMHAFILREARRDWGVNIPPGFTIEQRGKLWDITDHDNLAYVEQQVKEMRGWMRDHRQQDRPLWVTEYGILMPKDYGFSEEATSQFLTGSFDLFSHLRNPATGDPGDDFHLVQRWCWYSARDSRYPTGNLFDNWGRLTPVGDTLTRYLAQHVQ